MILGNFEDLPRRIASDKVLHDAAFDIAKNNKCLGYQHRLVSMVLKIFDKKSATHANNSDTSAT